ncbi:MAG: hypothetical protein WBP79_16925 [Candidatus Acidiferrales bacterium]
MSDKPTSEPLVVVHAADTYAEAMVIRSLLESEGIKSPEPSPEYPFLFPGTPFGRYQLDVCVLESQADAARSLIEAHINRSGAAAEPDESSA